MKKILYMTICQFLIKLIFLIELGRNMNLTVVLKDAQLPTEKILGFLQVFLISMPCLWMEKNMEMRLPFVLKFVR